MLKQILVISLNLLGQNVFGFFATGRFGQSGFSAYTASKFGVVGFSESLRLEVKRFGVRVITIEPGLYKYFIFNIKCI